MTKPAPSKFLPGSAILLCALAVLSFSAPAYAQNGLVMQNILGKLGILPEEKDPIEYRERPGLVVPKELDRLRPPERAEAHAKNGQWPVDPDAVERERERRRRNAPVFFPTASDPSEGGRLSLKELAAGRSVRGATMGESGVPRNDKDGVRLGIEEMTAVDKQARAPTYPPGTEPPRKYLTDPPVGLRIPSAGAAIGKRTTDDPTVDNLKVDDAWKRLD